MKNKTECVRCGAIIEDNQNNYQVGEQDYCENCHDDMFVIGGDK